MIMGKKLVFSCLFLVTFLGLQAQVLYEISGNNSRAKSYIFATNRLVDIPFLDSVPNLFKAYGRCDKVVVEFALNEAKAKEILAQAALLPDSQELRQYYSLQEYNEINQMLLQLVKLPFNDFTRMKPAYITELIRTELIRKYLGYDENHSSEYFFLNVALQQQCPVYGLDNVTETMYMLFDREPFEWQQKELLKVVRCALKEVEHERQLSHLYRNGKMSDIVYQITMPDNTTSLSYSDYRIFAQRNREWVKRLAPYLHEGKSFIVLNAIYLGGGQGLLAQLRANGYKVKAFNRTIEPRKWKN